MSMKNPLTQAGVEQVTFRFVAQHLNHCATAVPLSLSKPYNFCDFYLGTLSIFKLLTVVDN